MIRSHVLICGGTGCTSSGSKVLISTFESEIEKNGLAEEVKVVQTGCFGLCALGPVVIIYPEGAFYSRVQASDVAEIVSEHLLKGRLVDRLVYKDADESVIEEAGKTISLNDTNFYKTQKRVALRNCGVIDPENIDEYIAHDGYQALEMCLNKLTPDEVISIVKDSGLRGRGGGGFSTGLKWSFAAKNAADQKYVVCNADEGDPGAFMDRSILEGDPHCIIEAMAICGYAIGATEGYVYVRAEYPIAVKRLQLAIDQAKEYGLLGKNIFDSGFDFDLHIRLGAGAFVCGEETALMTSIEGNRGEPRPRPPFPAVKGLWGKPTILNNVETYANIPVIINKGAEWFNTIGTEKSKGTKVFALGGKINNTGLVEIPMGTTLRELIYDIGGGIPNGKQFKAIQTGGPSGGCLTVKDLDTPIDYDNLVALGSMMGSGGAIVMDEDNCMVDVAKFYMEFCVDESCGKCSPCRIGTRQMHTILEKISRGNGELEDLQKLKDIGQAMKSASLCALGQSAPNPTLSTLNKFEQEYIDHIVSKKCVAGKCKKLISYEITEKCIGCGMCAKNCPANCIVGEKKSRHVIEQNKCLKCGQCEKTCKFGAIIKK